MNFNLKISLLLAISVLLATVSGVSHARTDEVVYFLPDAQGSAIAAVNEKFELCWSEEYTPYGNKYHDEEGVAAIVKSGCGLIGSERGFTGHIEDFSTDLVYMQQRYYDPSIGRFLSIDSLGVDEFDSKRNNRYSYANNNPANLIDPDGRVAETPLDVISAAIGFASGINNARSGNLGAAFGDVLGAIIDTAAAFTPGVPGVIGITRQASKAADVARINTVENGRDKTNFIVDNNGTAVRNDASAARRDLESAGFPGHPTTGTTESGTLHRGVPGTDGPMDVRIMDGQANGGALKGPRVRTTRSGTNDSVRTDGSRFRNNESRNQRLGESHIHLGE